MFKSSSPRRIAALPILAAVLVVALAVVGAVYFANRDQGNTNTVVTTNTANVNGGANANTAPANVNTPANSNSATNTNASSNTNKASTPDWRTYHDVTVGYTLKYPPTWTVAVIDSSEDPGVLPEGTQLRHPVLRYVRITDPQSSTQVEVGIRAHGDPVTLTTRVLFFADTANGPYANDDPLMFLGQPATPITQQSDAGYYAFFVASYSGTAEYSVLVDGLDVYVEARRTDGERMSAATIEVIRTILASITRG